MPGVTWEQWTHGFNAELLEDPACTISWSGPGAGTPGDKNTVIATIPSSTDTEDEAYAIVNDLQFFSNVDQGWVKFKVRTPSTAWTVGNISVFQVRNRAGSPVAPFDFYLELGATLNFGLFSAATTLRSTSLNQTSAMVAALDTEYEVEGFWFGSTAANGIRRCWIDGSLQFDQTGLDMVTAGDCSPGLLWAGVIGYAGSDATPKTVQIRMAQLSDQITSGLVSPDRIPALRHNLPQQRQIRGPDRARGRRRSRLEQPRRVSALRDVIGVGVVPFRR